jgi:FMN reductase [NAD(P)H]
MTEFAALWRGRYGLDAPAADAPAELSPAMELILRHRSIRRFRDAPVAEPLLQALLACAQSAPTKSNLQQYSIVDIRDPELRRRLAELFADMEWAISAPVLLVFLGDMRRGRRIAEMRGYPHRNDNADCFMNAAVDAAVAMQSFIIAAEAAGLGCCPLSELRNRLDDLAGLIGLPAGVFPVAGLAAGWPAEEGHLSVRLPQPVVVHRDRYDDTGLEAEISAYDARAHARRPIPPHKQRHPDRYGVIDECTWSENVARQLSLPERDDFRGFLQRQEIGLN